MCFVEEGIEVYLKILICISRCVSVEEGYWCVCRVGGIRMYLCMFKV